MTRYERQSALWAAGYKTLALTPFAITRQHDGGWWFANPGETLWNAKDAPGRNGATGYYCDDNQDEIYVPAVIRLGKRLFAGYLDPWNGGFRASPYTFATDSLDAAKQMAVRFTRN